MAAESTAKTTNLEKIIYFLSLMSFSINRLKSCILFSCKKFVFWFYVEKEFMLQEMVKCWRPLPLPPFSTALHLLHNYPTFATKRQYSEQSPDIDGWNFGDASQTQILKATYDYTLSTMRWPLFSSCHDFLSLSKPHET